MAKKKKQRKRRREPEVKEEYLKKLDRIEKKHFKKYGYRSMSLEELKKLCGQK